MKDCFRSFHLPVNDIKSPHADRMNVAFGSQICNDHTCAGVVVTYNRQQRYVGITITFHLNVPSERVTEVIRLLDLWNGMMPLDHYSVCECCNSVSMWAVLFLHDDSLPDGKFKRLIHDMLEYAYFSFPLIIEVINGGKQEDVHTRFTDGCRDLGKIEKAISSKNARTIISDMESVLHDLEISIREEDLHDDGLAIYFKTQEQFDFDMCMTIDRKSVV